MKRKFDVKNELRNQIKNDNQMLLQKKISTLEELEQLKKESIEDMKLFGRSDEDIEELFGEELNA